MRIFFFVMMWVENLVEKLSKKKSVSRCTLINTERQFEHPLEIEARLSLEKLAKFICF